MLIPIWPALVLETINKWYDYLDKPTLADAILDRILQHANRIELKGQSMGVRKNMQQNQV